MKYAFYFFFLIFANSFELHARTITTFHDSPAIMNIAQFMIDNAEDLPVSNRISDKKLIVKEPGNCIVVDSSAVIKEVQAAIKSVLRLFPDEELPIEEAMSDLADYIGPGPLFKCTVIQSNRIKKIVVSYFYDHTDSVHVKVDTITLLPE